MTNAIKVGAALVLGAAMVGCSAGDGSGYETDPPPERPVRPMPGATVPSRPGPIVEYAAPTEPTSVPVPEDTEAIETGQTQAVPLPQ